MSLSSPLPGSSFGGSNFVGGRKHRKVRGKSHRRRRGSRGKSGGNFLGNLAVPAGLLILQKALHGSTREASGSHKRRRRRGSRGSKRSRSSKRSRRSRRSRR